MDLVNNINRQVNTSGIETFKRFFKRFYPCLCMYANRFLHDADLSKDIAQEAFLYYWNRKELINTERHAQSLLYQFVKNRCLNYIRDKKILINTSFAENGDELAEEEIIINYEAYEIIYQAIKKLSPQGIQVIEYSLDGLNNNEIAAILGISVNTVKTVKKRAFKFLKSELKSYYFNLFIQLLL